MLAVVIIFPYGRLISAILILAFDVAVDVLKYLQESTYKLDHWRSFNTPESGSLLLLAARVSRAVSQVADDQHHHHLGT